jgi:sarcosine oxidase subunit beta
MSSHTADVIVIGAGIVGASVAYHLAKRGCTNVLILERADAAVTGSTALSAAGVRHLFSNEVNILLSKYSIERLKHFTEETGGYSDLRQIGYLFLINNEETWKEFQEQSKLQKSLGVKVEMLEPQDVLKFVPGAQLDDIVGATFGPEDGFCDPHGIATGYLKRARELGARVSLSSPVTGAQLSADRVTKIETPKGIVSGEYVVNACGAWSGKVAALFGIDLPVQPVRHHAFMTESFPQFPESIPLTFDVDSGFWMRKSQDNILFGMSNPNEQAGEKLNIDWNWLPTVLDAGINRFPLLENARLAKSKSWAGLYEISPDHNPILGRHPEMPNYLHASGFSGHGVMHSPATGMLIAEEILDGRAHTVNIDELRITRFQNKSIQHEMNFY